MNKQMKILSLGLMSFALATGMQVQALPFFKKTAGLFALAVGAKYAWANRSSIKNSVQELKKNPLALYKKKMSDGKELLSSAIVQLTFLKSWIGQKVTGLFANKTKLEDSVSLEVDASSGHKRKIIFAEAITLDNPNLESNI